MCLIAIVVNNHLIKIKDLLLISLLLKKKPKSCKTLWFPQWRLKVNQILRNIFHMITGSTNEIFLDVQNVFMTVHIFIIIFGSRHLFADLIGVV